MPNNKWLYYHPTDAPNYLSRDSGCTRASKLLGFASNCLENCPFPECYYVLSPQKQVVIQRLLKAIDKINNKNCHF